MNDPQQFFAEHVRLTRRFFLSAGAVCMAAEGALSSVQSDEPAAVELTNALAKMEPYFTRPADSRDVSRGKMLCLRRKADTSSPPAVMPQRASGSWTRRGKSILAEQRSLRKGSFAGRCRVHQSGGSRAPHNGKSGAYDPVPSGEGSSRGSRGRGTDR